MDALALLCNLHADGPDTLGSLREAGCSDLTDLVAFEVEDLAKLLELDLGASQRLLREAQGLEARLTGEGHRTPRASAAAEKPVAPPSRAGGDADDERADVVYRRPPAPAPKVSPDAAAELEDALGEVPDENDIDFSMREGDAEGSHPVIQAVLETWRELDDDQPARPEPSLEPERVIVPRIPESDLAEPRRPLAQVELEGMTREAFARLADTGLTTLEQFISGDPLLIAKTSGVPYTRVVRAQFLARRQAVARPHEPTAGPFA